MCLRFPTSARSLAALERRLKGMKPRSRPSRRQRSHCAAQQLTSALQRNAATQGLPGRSNRSATQGPRARSLVQTCARDRTSRSDEARLAGFASPSTEPSVPSRPPATRSGEPPSSSFAPPHSEPLNGAEALPGSPTPGFPTTRREAHRAGRWARWGRNCCAISQ